MLSGAYSFLLTLFPDAVGKIPFELFVVAPIFLMAVDLLLCDHVPARVLTKEQRWLWFF